MKAASELGQEVGKKAACEALGVPRATYYRHVSNKSSKGVSQINPPLALSESEQQQVLDELHSERFQDRSPREVYAVLLDEGRYLCPPPGPCTAYWTNIMRSRSAGNRLVEPIIKNPNCLPLDLTRYGHGT